jgi:ABC-type nitrate/sulfonate/bicarbonate transport system ATPase subunit
MVFERTTARERIRTRALAGATFDVKRNEFVSLIGSSGSGKSTILKIVGGLLRQTSGTVEVIGRPVTRPGPDRAVVFQSPGLMPWRTVHGNVCLALELLHVPPGERDERATRYIELAGLAAFADHLPAELSGGMAQRVGLVRALAAEPQVLLMDEPFGALDAITRLQMQIELLRIWERDKRTVLFVTHAINEAILLSDRILVLGQGRVVHEVEVPLPRPRVRSKLLGDPAVVAMTRDIESFLGVTDKGGGV